MFAGLSRKATINIFLQELCGKDGIILDFVEMDLLINSDHDVLNDDAWQDIKDKVDDGAFLYLIITPTCAQHSRALFSSHKGALPLRDRFYPLGYPWIHKPSDRKKIYDNNTIHNRTVEMINSAAQSAAKTKFLVEFPEDLGRHVRGVPATLWSGDFQRMIESFGGASSAHFSCKWGVDYLKPERFASNIAGHLTLGVAGWPKLDENYRYSGPLPAKCSCAVSHAPLIGKNLDGSFKRARAATFPPKSTSKSLRLSIKISF